MSVGQAGAFPSLATSCGGEGRLPDSAALGEVDARLGQAGLLHRFLSEQVVDDLVSGPVDARLRAGWRSARPYFGQRLLSEQVVNYFNRLHALNYTGLIYDESGIAGGRGTMSNRGEKTSWDAENKRHNNPLPESADDLKKLLHNTSDWNDIVLIVNGNHVQYSISGHLMTEMIDESPKAVLKGGVIALQMHAGFAMDIQFKDIAIKFLDGNP
jgi:hypothetical protein